MPSIHIEGQLGLLHRSQQAYHRRKLSKLAFISDDSAPETRINGSDEKFATATAEGYWKPKAKMQQLVLKAWAAPQSLEGFRLLENDRRAPDVTDDPIDSVIGNCRRSGISRYDDRIRRPLA